jgi:hypothetical protein
VFDTIRMILSLNACLPLCMDPYKNLCKKTWNVMDSFEISYNDQWVCIEDFNTITSPNDKLGGRPFDSLQIFFLTLWMNL